MSRAPAEDPVALRQPAVARFFARVMARQVAGSFRAARLARPGLPDLPSGRPLIVYTNHPSWWDPAVMVVIQSRLFPGREAYAPIEAAMLERYAFFRRVGIFGVAEGRAGAARFLRTSEAILADPRRMLWVTAQGRFADPRERPLALRPGIAHLLARMPRAVAVPLALEYPFWSEKRPEALAAFGTPLDGAEGGDAAAWGGRLETALTQACDRLAGLAQARDPAAFEGLLAGRAGVGGVYGAWQRLRSLARGRAARPRPPARAAAVTLALAILTLLLAALYAGMTFANLRAYRAPPPPGAVPPRVSVLIPARDEEANIGPALACVLASTGVEIEVVVLDDGSTDRTAGIVQAVAAREPGVELVQGAPLPPGWIGKQHACWQLSLAARHPLLVFLDADVRLEPEALARLAAFSKGLGLVSGLPRQVTLTLGERIAVPQILVVLLGYLPLRMARAAPTDPRFAAAIGQVLLVTREAYDRSGGHAAIRGTIHDGLRLARAVRGAGFGTDLCDLSRLATCRMYSNWRDLWAGFSKNAREGMATPRALPVWTLLLGGGHVLPILLLPFATGAAFWIALLAALLAWLAAGATAARTRASWVSALLHPVGVLVTLAIQWNALLAGRRRRPAVWRGRSYDL